MKILIVIIGIILVIAGLSSGDNILCGVGGFLFVSGLFSPVQRCAVCDGTGMYRQTGMQCSICKGTGKFRKLRER